MGDNSWNLACFAYLRKCYAIEQAVLHEYSDWLAIVDPPLRFCYSMGGVPVRFFRGDPAKNAPDNQVMLSVAEREAQFALDLDDAKPPIDTTIHRMVLTFDAATLLVDRVLLARFASSGRAIDDAWEIPHAPTASAKVLTIGADEPRVELSPASVAMVEDIIAEEIEEVRKEGA